MTPSPQRMFGVRGWSPSAVDVWFHGASIGDMRALAPLVASFRDKHPNSTFCISATTSEGREMGRKLFGWQHVRPAPLSPLTVGAIMKKSRPKVLVLEYLELWPHWIAACARLGIKVMVVDGHITHRSLRIRHLLRRAASRLAYFCAQTHDDAYGARTLGVVEERIKVHGNGKYDGLCLDAPRIPDGAERCLGRFDVVVGSLNPAEEREALHEAARSRLRVLFAPRYLSQVKPILSLAQRLGIRAMRRSEAHSTCKWVILDSVGELSWAYGLGDVAIVGGSFCSREGQNLVEAAAHRIPVIFGPRTGNIRVEVAALHCKGGYQVPDWRAAFDLASQAPIPVGGSPDPLVQLRGATARNLSVLEACMGLVNDTES